MQGGRGGVQTGEQRKWVRTGAAVTSETGGDKCHQRVQPFPVPPQTNGGATCLEVQQRSMYVQNVARSFDSRRGEMVGGARKPNWI